MFKRHSSEFTEKYNELKAKYSNLTGSSQMLRLMRKYADEELQHPNSGESNQLREQLEEYSKKASSLQNIVFDDFKNINDSSISLFKEYTSIEADKNRHYAREGFKKKVSALIISDLLDLEFERDQIENGSMGNLASAGTRQLMSSENALLMGMTAILTLFSALILATPILGPIFGSWLHWTFLGIGAAELGLASKVHLETQDRRSLGHLTNKQKTILKWQVWGTIPFLLLAAGYAGVVNPLPTLALSLTFAGIAAFASGAIFACIMFTRGIFEFVNYNNTKQSMKVYDSLISGLEAKLKTSDLNSKPKEKAALENRLNKYKAIRTKLNNKANTHLTKGAMLMLISAGMLAAFAAPHVLALVGTAAIAILAVKIALPIVTSIIFSFRTMLGVNHSVNSKMEERLIKNTATTFANNNSAGAAVGAAAETS